MAGWPPHLRDLLGRIGGRALTARQLVDEPEPDYRWLFPGLLELGDRVMFTANEGAGKSELMRMIAVQAALGIAPFTLEELDEPKRVLLVDFENPERMVKRKIVELCDRADVEVPDLLTMMLVPKGIDMKTEESRSSLIYLIDEVKPQLVLGGPIYKMGYNISDEQEWMQLQYFLDDLRIRYEFTLILEAHQGNAQLNPRKEGRMWVRNERPIGTSAQLRWPEFGMCLQDGGALMPWRGARDERPWPKKLSSAKNYPDQTWPWEVVVGGCLKCGKELTGRQNKYCSERCANAGRQQDFRRKSGPAPQLRIVDSYADDVELEE